METEAFRISSLKKFLATWRQNIAVKRNLALSYIVKSEHLWKVAKYNPRNIAEMLELGLTHNEIRIYGKKFFSSLPKLARYLLIIIHRK